MPSDEFRADPADRPPAGARATAARRSARRPPGDRSRRRVRWTRRLSSLALLGFLWAAIGLGGVFAWYGVQLPPIDDLESATRRPGLTVTAADGTVIASSGDIYGRPYAVRDLPPTLPAAVIAIEDHRFYHHFGIDPVGLARAAWINHRSGRVVQGGSTITQQLAKNLFLSPERSLTRKIQEVMLALWLEHRFTKDQILGIYLNRVYFGAGAYGVDAAAQRYFGIHATGLTLRQSALLAGMLRAPTRYSPARDPVRAAERAQTVLTAMADQGVVTQEQAQTAAVATGAAAAVVRRPGPYFADWVFDQIDGFVTVDRDLVVETTLDPTMQRAAESATALMLDAAGAKRRVGQAAIVALEGDGAIRAMVGGRDYRASQFNRATQALRQPGSAFKLFVYLAALEQGATPESVLVDSPISIAGWAPRNFDDRYYGPVSLTAAFAKSLNSVAVQLIERTGPRRVIEMARRLGVTAALPREDSIALGTSGVSLLELAGAYRTIAQGGLGVWPYGIVAIRDTAGRVLWRRDGSGPGRVIAPAIIDAIQPMLAAVVESGTGRAAAFGPQIYGKTGTTQDYRDAWFIGASGALTLGVWCGNDDDTPMAHVTGGDLPAKLWRTIMQTTPLARKEAAPGAAAPAALIGVAAHPPATIAELIEATRQGAAP